MHEHGQEFRKTDTLIANCLKTPPALAIAKL